MKGFIVDILKTKDGRYVAVILVLGFLGIAAGARIRQLDAVIAQKPKIEYREKVIVKTVRVAGPVRIEEKIIEVPGNGRTIERVVYREAVKTETGKETETERKEEAACPPAPRSPRWIAGPSLAPLALDPSRKLRGARGGVSLFDRALLIGGYDFSGQDRVSLDLLMRF